MTTGMMCLYDAGGTPCRGRIVEWHEVVAVQGAGSWLRSELPPINSPFVHRSLRCEREPDRHPQPLG